MIEVNEAFGAPNRGCYLAHDDFSARAFWPLIIGRPEHRNYKSDYSKATMPINLAQRLVAQTLKQANSD